MAARAPSESDVDGPEGPPQPARATGGRSRRRWLLPLVAATVVAAGVVGVLVLGDDDDREAPSARSQATPSLPPPVVADLDPEAQQLLELLEKGRRMTYHATYVASGDAAVIGTEMKLQVWRDDGLVRQDSRQVTAAGTVETAGLVLGDNRTILCQRVDAVAWTCARQEGVQERAADGVFGSLATQLKGADVVVTQEEVAGRRAHCFSVTGPEGEISECVAENGVPLRLRTQGSELVLSDLSDRVPDDVFEPPAKPAEA